MKATSIDYAIMWDEMLSSGSYMIKVLPVFRCEGLTKPVVWFSCCNKLAVLRDAKSNLNSAVKR